ncbi:gluconolactonase [Burkholderia sp. YR290]|nr:gluconolactonase [Burkholderia sp. YR290]
MKTVTDHEIDIVTEGLAFPEGPICQADGSVLVVEIKGQTLTRVHPDGSRHVVAHLGGGPNGAAIGPDGACYVCNNGGARWAIRNGRPAATGIADDYQGGLIQRIDLGTGEVRTLYDRVEDRPLRGPNDLVFDAHGGFYFTDMGKVHERSIDRGSVYYAKADGSMIKEVIFPISMPNGAGLSPDGRTLYVSETETARLWSWSVVAPGELAYGTWHSPAHGGKLVYNEPGYRRFDSLAIEANGNICVATLEIGAVTIVSPQGQLVEQLKIPGDTHVTNLCFGGPDLRSAWVTLSYAGKLVKVPWARCGLALNFN